MNVLLIAPRFPWPAYTGDRLRTTIWLDALRGANVALVAPRSGGQAEKSSHGFASYPAERSVANGARAIVRVLSKGLPWQSLLAAPYAWHDAIARARTDFGSFDATIVILTRLHPWIPPVEGTRILDAIDSLARNSHERARAASVWTRWIWRAEERRTARDEEAIARTYDHILYVSDDEAAAHGIAISNGVQVRPLESRRRAYDFGFWGRLPYFANADAARWLIDEIWPAIRAIKPDATLVIAGADAPSQLRRAAERAGITFISPAGDIPALARDIRVAILPLRYGSGESTKMLEAAEAGCAVVATPRGVRGLPELAREATIVEDAQGLARAAVQALTQRDTELRRLVVQHYARERTLEKLSEIVRRKAA